MPLEECLTRITHRQFLTYRDYFRAQWEEPSRADYYAMQVALGVYNSIPVKKPARSLDDFRLRFKSDAPVDEKTLLELSKAKWFTITRHVTGK